MTDLVEATAVRLFVIYIDGVPRAVTNGTGAQAAQAQVTPMVRKDWGAAAAVRCVDAALCPYDDLNRVARVYEAAILASQLAMLSQAASPIARPGPRLIQ